ncbi:MAG: diacylglycerol kinase family protein [Clostridia bacterium]|nr:diacylglycerol kinase family protein [Clostridia bacterium]
MNYKVLYNPLAGRINDTVFFNELKTALKGDTLEYFDITKVDLAEFAGGVKEDEGLIVAGGDGTLNRFINQTVDMKIAAPVYYYAAGNGNDFWTDIGKKAGDKPVELAPYIKDLPTVEVNGKTYKFINGVGFGIDGYCCEVGDKLKAQDKKVDYTGIAIKGLLFHFKPATAKVTVDGETKEFKNVWVAPTMNGRMYGGGMLPTPAQDRLNEERTVSTCVFYGKGRLKILTIFPKIFKGEHIKKTKNVCILSGKQVTVEFDRPCALQIDGETVLNVTKYTVTSAKQ